MTKQTISELLEESGSDTISYRGRVVRALVRIPVKDGSLVKVKRESVNSPRLQALKISVNKNSKIEFTEQFAFLQLEEDNSSFKSYGICIHKT